MAAAALTVRGQRAAWMTRALSASFSPCLRRISASSMPHIVPRGMILARMRRIGPAIVCSVGMPRTAAARTGRGDVDGGEEQISETQFHERADVALQHLHDTLDGAELDDIDDISLEDGVLSVKLAEGGAFVINKHFATRQIWYASPVSGALYFSAASAGGWVAESRGESLEDVFTADLVKLVPDAAAVKFKSTG
mmetsp:Transcript_125323/g.360019  ORF Transcript_125323/g.360019 Transcript_125323/m.360019 type:complete len:195 (-) Transcript_125323:56-640(-)